MKIELNKLATNLARITGKDLVLENKENGTIYMTSKKYMDKLFKDAGYQNTKVINILEEFAGKIVSEVKGLGESEIYIDDITMSFIVTSETSLITYNKLLEYLNENGFTCSIKNMDTYHTCDQLLISKEGTSDRVLYVSLLEETITSYSLDYKDGILIGMTFEGEYGMKDPATINEVEFMLNSKVDNSYAFSLDQKVSVQEYADVLLGLGILKRKRGKKIMSLDDDYPNIENIVADYNDKTWIQRAINENVDLKKFEDVCEVITSYFNNILLCNIYPFYENNAKETSDFFALSY